MDQSAASRWMTVCSTHRAAGMVAVLAAALSFRCIDIAEEEDADTLNDPDTDVDVVDDPEVDPDPDIDADPEIDADDPIERDIGAICSADIECGSGRCSNSHCAPDGFAYIPAGTFIMGSPDGLTADPGTTTVRPEEPGRLEDELLHQVTLTGPYFLATHEVTQAEWSVLMVSNPSSFSCDDCPVENVNWWEALEYTNRLSASEGLDPCYILECSGTPGVDLECSEEVTVDAPGQNPHLCRSYRLPTEAEWERAYRAETNAAFYNGDITRIFETPLDPNLNAIGWYAANSDGTTHVVGPLAAEEETAPNSWGLYDMSGNVWEWVWDRFWEQYYRGSPSEDPLGSVTAPQRSLRGGSWDSEARSCRAAKTRVGCSERSQRYRRPSRRPVGTRPALRE